MSQAKLFNFRKGQKYIRKEWVTCNSKSILLILPNDCKIFYTMCTQNLNFKINPLRYFDVYMNGANYT